MLPSEALRAHAPHVRPRGVKCKRRNGEMRYVKVNLWKSVEIAELNSRALLNEPT